MIDGAYGLLISIIIGVGGISRVVGHLVD